MNKDDLRDELPLHEWIFYGKVHLRTALWVSLGWMIGYVPLFLALVIK